MSNETPGQGPVPGWGQQPPEDATAPWPAEAVPPGVPWPTEADSGAPAEAETPAAPEPAPPAAVPPTPAPAAPWGAPASQPVAPVPGAPWAVPQQQPAQPAAPSWGAPPPQQQAPAPGAAPSWGAPPPPQQQAPGGWGPPPQQPGGWSPGGPGAPGGPPVGWAPAPAKSGNGCLKGCLIIGAIGIVLLILLFIGLAILGQRFAQDMGINPDGTVTACSIVSSAEVSDALDGDAEVLPLGGIVDATVGQLLDKRVLRDAEDCWIAGDTVATGRIARQAGGDATGAFRSARDAAQSGAYFAGDVPSLGDEAFCTGMSEAGSFGVLVRRGDTLAYVSLISPSATGPNGFETNDDGVIVSPETCALAGKVADAVLR